MGKSNKLKSSFIGSLILYLLYENIQLSCNIGQNYSSIVFYYCCSNKKRTALLVSKLKGENLYNRKN